MGIMKYQFDNNPNGDMCSSPDGRNPEDLRKCYEQQLLWAAPEYKAQKEAKERDERERLEKVRREKVDVLLAKGEAAKQYPVSDGNGVCKCPILATEVENAEWAVLGEQCFPVKFQGEKAPFVLDKERGVIGLQDLIEGRYGKKGYFFNKW